MVVIPPGELGALGWKRGEFVEPVADPGAGCIVLRRTDGPKRKWNTKLTPAGSKDPDTRCTVTSWFGKLVGRATREYGRRPVDYSIANGILTIQVPREWLAERAAHERQECHKEVVSDVLGDLGVEPSNERQGDTSAGELHPLTRDPVVLALLSLALEELERCGILVRR